jgi:hypothetical protein
MPWTVDDVDKYNKGLSRKSARKWVAIANSSLKTCIAKGGTDETCAPKAIQIANGVVKRDKERAEAKMPKIKEAVTKKLGGKSYPAACFLVVEDPEKPTTWHLPVKTPNGKADRALAGAAWAALFSKGGFRGNKYEGASKSKAQAALKALYKANDWPEPAEEAAESEPLAEYADDILEWYGEEPSSIPYVPSGVVSFDQLDVLKQSEEIFEHLRDLTGMYTQMVQNIVFFFEGDKVSQIADVSDEFVARLDGVINGQPEEIASDMPPEQEEPEEPTAETAEAFAEAEASSIIALEADPQPDNVLRMDIAIIKPGWGNKQDNHYYSAEMLRACAQNFSGAKMYETDHRPEEKSTRTWVSTITEITGYTDDGAPIGRVAVHDPGFAERVRNLSKAGLLSKLECSIFAAGKAEGGFEQDGRTGKRVLEISDVSSVDWVTKAGAGGRALSLAESEGDQNMEEDKDKEVTPVVTEETTVAVQEAIVPAASGSEGTEAEIPTAEVATESNTPILLSAEAVRSLLDASRLPAAAIERLSEMSYADESAVSAAVEAERAYLAKLLNAGKVVGMGETDKLSRAAYDPAKVREAAERVNQKYFGH